MRQQAFLAASVIMIAASLPRAQTRTADGVDAFVRGDYQRAADILKPIAEQPFQADHVAEFFMAALYETGRGVPVDAVRSCALYSRAASDRTGPFGIQANAVLMMLHASMGKEEFQDCELLANTGFDHRFQPVTFALGPGHWIAMDLKGTTITYQGKERRLNTGFSSRGDVYLPIQHTELEVGPSRSSRRHFIEIFKWMPARDKHAWTLSWSLGEVVRDDLIGITSELTVTIPGEQPPSGLSYDVRKIATLRVNDNGEPEWAVLAGPHPRTAVIESEAERQEEKRLAVARTTADARVDWARVRDIRRAPALTYAGADGCGNVFVYGWSDDRTEAIAIRADKALLQLSTTAKTFDVAVQSGLELVLHVYGRPLRSWPFCTDVGFSGLEEETWRATRGTVTIELSPPGVRPRAPFQYRATIRIVGAEFVNGSGVRVLQKQPITLTAMVGSISG